MTRKDILKKTRIQLDEQCQPEGRTFRTGGTRIPDKENEPSGQKRRREEETGWQKQMYNQFMKGADR